MTHKERMIARRQRQHARKSDVVHNVTANLGRAHPDYGVHPLVHALHKEWAA